MTGGMWRFGDGEIAVGFTRLKVDYAKRVIAAFETAEGGLVLVDGKLIEKPVLRSMYRILAVAGATR